MILKNVTATALAASLTMFTSAHAEVIRIGSIAEYQPYNYLDDEGEMQGFEAGLASLICLQASLNCEWVLSPQEDLIGNLQAGNFDIIISAMEISAENQLYIDFSEEYLPLGTISTLGVTLADPVGIGISSSNPALLASLNAALATIKSDGSLDTLVSAWFEGLDPEYRNLP